MLKVDVYVPPESLNEILAVIKELCAGKSDKYAYCISWHRVESLWKPLEGANPYRGIVGKEQNAWEYLVTFRCGETAIEEIKQAINAKHPYEEPIIDVYDLR